MLKLFDTETNAGRQNEQLRQHLTMMMAYFARNTLAWDMMQPLNKVSGTHFIILDWISNDWIRTILRPVILHRADLISSSEIIDIQAELIEHHLTTRPGDEPLRARPWRQP